MRASGSVTAPLFLIDTLNVMALRPGVTHGPGVARRMRLSMYVLLSGVVMTPAGGGTEEPVVVFDGGSEVDPGFEVVAGDGGPPTVVRVVAEAPGELCEPPQPAANASNAAIAATIVGFRTGADDTGPHPSGATPQTT